jgi:integrase
MDRESITQHNKELIEKFKNNCFSEGLSACRVTKYMHMVPKIAGILGKCFDQTEIEDIKRVVAEIEKSEYAEWTKRDYKVTIKKFYKWLEGNGEEFPKKVRWIRATMKNHNKKLPEELLSEDDVIRLIEAARHIETKAIIAVLWESGARIAEILGMKRKHVVLSEDMAHITISGKTGDRRIPLITSVPYLANWLNNHPEKNPDAYVWVCRESSNRRGKIGYAAVRKMINLTAKAASLDKKVNPHMFRHSRASCLANKLTESQLKQYFGWVQASDMASIYVHLSGRDIDNAILEIHGKRRPEESETSKLMPKKCGICHFVNEATAPACDRCGRPLDTQAAMEFAQAREAFTASVMKAEIARQIKEEMIKFLRNSSGKGLNIEI